MEQQGVEKARVLPGDRGDGQGEDEVEVGAVEHFRAPLTDPGGAGKALALGAVTVAAGR